MNDESNIVNLLGDTVAITKNPKNRDSKFTNCCPNNCKRIEVDEDQRRVTCEDCGRAVDAFEYLLQWANEADNRMDGLKNLRVEEKTLQASIDFMKLELKKLKRVMRESNPAHPSIAHPWSLDQLMFAEQRKKK